MIGNIHLYHGVHQTGRGVSVNLQCVNITGNSKVLTRRIVVRVTDLMREALNGSKFVDEFSIFLTIDGIKPIATDQCFLKFDFKEAVTQLDFVVVVNKNKEMAWWALCDAMDDKILPELRARLLPVAF